MLASRRNRFDQLLTVLYALALTAFVAALLHHHWQIISAQFPLDYYEGTTLLITQIIADGGNPYTREYQPWAMYVYPPLFNMVVAPFTWLVGNSLQLHRIACGLFILVSCFLVARIVWRQGTDLLESLSAAGLLYAALLFFITPISSTNAMGVLLFLVMIYVPLVQRFSIRSLVLSALLGIAAFYTKQYFILAIGLLCSWVFLYQSRLRGVWVGGLFFGLLMASLWPVHLSSPYYLDNTLFSTAIAADRLQSTEIALRQYKDFAVLYWPLLLLASIQLWLFLRDHGVAGIQQLLVPRTEPGGTAGAGLQTRNVYYSWFCLLLGAAVVFFSLARNPGNYLSYLFQLLSPLLLVAVFGGMPRLGRARRLLGILVVLCFYQAWSLLPRDFSTTEANWKKVDSIIAGDENFLTSQVLLANLLRHDRRVYQDGHTFYFPLAADKPRWFKKRAEQDRVEAVWEQYIERLYRDIENQYFDAIIITPLEQRGIFVTNPPPFSQLTGYEFLRRYYYLEESFPLSMTKRRGGGNYRFQVWRPQHEAPGAE